MPGRTALLAPDAPFWQAPRTPDGATLFPVPRPRTEPARADSFLWGETHAPPPYKTAIWLLSDGRSGSTWFAGLLNFHQQFHIEQEPVHALHTPALAGEPLLPLPGDAGGDHAALIGDILARRYAGARFGPPAPGREGLVIRDIHALMIAPTLLRHFPQLRPVVLVRHPVEVAMSKLALPQWRWFDDVAGFLLDPELAAFIGERARYICAAKTPFERYVLHWAVSHAWFFAHAPTEKVAIVHYPLAPAETAQAVAQVLRGVGVELAAAGPEYAAAFAQRSYTDRPAPARRRSAPTASRAERRWTETMIDAFGLRWLIG